MATGAAVVRVIVLIDAGAVAQGIAAVAANATAAIATNGSTVSGARTDIATGAAVASIGLEVGRGDASAVAAGLPARADMAAGAAVQFIGFQIGAQAAALAIARFAGSPAGITV